MTASLPLPLTDQSLLRRRVLALAENRPAVYRVLDHTGRVIYVGKAKRLRNRLLSYFRAQYPEDKQARILNAAAGIDWDDMPSEFAALLGELRQIRRYRPVFNVRMNRSRRTAFVKISPGPAPKIYVGTAPGPEGTRHYGPFTGVGRLKEGVRTLNDLLGLRDCAARMPMAFPEQGDLFSATQHALCMRHDLGHCLGPCAALVTEKDYQDRIEAATALLEARSIAPIDQVVEEMTRSSEQKEFEQAAWWRNKFENLEWLLSASTRSRVATSTLTFVYLDPGTYGDDRAYIVSHATVRASAPAPRTPIEREAFRALVARHAEWQPTPGALPIETVDETVLLLQWFRRRPGAFRRTVSFDEWLNGDGSHGCDSARREILQPC
jgi:excinuclease ABC subunit C